MQDGLIDFWIGERWLFAQSAGSGLFPSDMVRAIYSCDMQGEHSAPDILFGEPAATA